MRDRAAPGEATPAALGLDRRIRLTGYLADPRPLRRHAGVVEGPRFILRFARSRASDYKCSVRPPALAEWAVRTKGARVVRETQC